jgi:glutaredoxin
MLALVGALLCGGGAIAATTLAGPGHAALPAPSATLQIGFAGAGAAAVAPAARTVAAPTGTPEDDPQTAWLKQVARGDPSSPSPATTASAPGNAAAAPRAATLSVQAASRGIHVVVYTTGWCPHCKRAKAWMSGQGIAYEERNIESSTQYAQENRRINPRGSIPTFDVDGDVMVGFTESDLVAMIERASRRHAAQN